VPAALRHRKLNTFALANQHELPVCFGEESTNIFDFSVKLGFATPFARVRFLLDRKTTTPQELSAWMTA
jgi:hypothetical protein